MGCVSKYVCESIVNELFTLSVYITIKERKRPQETTKCTHAIDTIIISDIILPTIYYMHSTTLPYIHPRFSQGVLSDGSIRFYTFASRSSSNEDQDTNKLSDTPVGSNRATVLHALQSPRSEMPPCSLHPFNTSRIELVIGCRL